MGEQEKPSVVSVDSILGWLKKSVENKEPIPPSTWLDAAQKLVVLLEDVDSALILKEMEFNRRIHDSIAAGGTTAAATAEAKASQAYQDLLVLKAKKERVIETIRISKKRTEVPNWDTL